MDVAVDRDFEIYKLLVEEVREVRRARREIVNVYTTLNIAGVGALGFLTSNHSLNPALLIWLVVALVMICVIWRTSNAYFTTQLNKKYVIIYEREKMLGVDCLEREWHNLPRKGPIRWFGLERSMPLLFIVGYLIFLAYQVTIDDVTGMVQGAWRPLADIWDRFF